MKNSSSASEKWKRGFSKVISSKIKDPLVASSTFSEEEESNEMEIEAYYQRLKSKTSLKNLWDGKKFTDIVDDDLTPDVSTESESQLDLKMSSTLKNLHQIRLDSDEDEMRIDYIRENTVDENNNNVDESSDESVNLMNNVHFAELEINEVQLSDDDLKKEKPKDFLPRLYSAEVVEVFSSESKSFNSDDYRGLSKLESGDSSGNTEFRSKSKSKTGSEMDQTVEEIDEVLSEIQSIQSSYSESVVDKTGSDLSRSKSSYNKRSDSKQTSSRHSKSRSKSSKSRHLSDAIDRTSTRSTNDRTSSTSDLKELPSDDQSSGVSSTVSDSRYKKTSSLRSSGPSSRNSSFKYNEKSRTKDKSAHKEKRKTDNQKTKNVQTQTKALINDDKTDDVLNFRYDWQRKDPSNIVTHVLDPLTIDVLTNYNPSVLAANDLMKYHLQLLQQHIHDSRRLYEAYANENINNNYKYTTVEETKKYIEKNSPKVISYEEALKKAKEEEEYT